MGSRRSKEDDVNRISISIYVTNFPENFSAKELFQSCKQYGHVVDSFIPRKRTKEGKRFGFVRFINVFNVDRLVNNLCTIWVGQFKLHANKARFQRATLNKGQGADHKKVANSPRPNSGDSGSSNSYVNAVKNHKSVDHDSPAIVLDEDCALSKDLSSSLMGRIKEFASLTNLKNALMNEGFVDLNVSYLGELWVLLEFSSVKSKEAFRDNVGVSSWFSEIRQTSFDINPDGRIVWVEIEVYWIRAKEVPGWTPDQVEDSDEEELSDDDSLEEGMKNLESENDCRIFYVSILSGFSVYSYPIHRTRFFFERLPMIMSVPFRFFSPLDSSPRALKISSTSTWNSAPSVDSNGMRNFGRLNKLDAGYDKGTEDQSQTSSEKSSKQAIKTAVGLVGTDKSPGPDGDIVNEVQSAFIAERQMLDGPFILNEILQWCTKKKKKTLIFKVDFEKAFDSIRWDFLDDVLKEFDFRVETRRSFIPLPLYPRVEAFIYLFKGIGNAGMFTGVYGLQVIQAAAKLGCLVLKSVLSAILRLALGGCLNVLAWQ
ncbi:nucleotide-binding alpha-beta plait domain-containing protein [Tanacetum coccineum]